MMIKRTILSKFKTLSLNSYISEKSVQGLLLLFQILSLFLVISRDIKNFNKTKFSFMIGLVVFVYVSIKLVQKFTSGDYYIVLIANMLFSIGVLEIYRLEPKLAFRQIIWFFYRKYSFLDCIFDFKICKNLE